MYTLIAVDKPKNNGAVKIRNKPDISLLIILINNTHTKILQV
jgi:hypothetical protein